MCKWFVCISDNYTIQILSGKYLKLLNTLNKRIQKLFRSYNKIVHKKLFYFVIVELQKIAISKNFYFIYLNCKKNKTKAFTNMI